MKGMNIMKSRQVSPRTKTTCDKCGHEIELTAGALKEKHFPDGIRISYFSCNHCGERYVYLVTDPELRKDILRRGFKSSTAHMKLRADELKAMYAGRVKEL